MVPPDLISYIKEQSADGVAAQDLREALMGAGWSEYDVENALHDVAAGLEPLTAGASLHEDVAQVRGLVAHLASRIQRLETRLTAAGAMTAMPADLPNPETPVLPSGTIGPEHELVAGRHPGMVFKIVSTLGALAALALFGFFFQTLVEKSQQAPLAFLEVAGLVGLLHILLAWIMMRRGRAWSAELAVATGVAFWAVTVWHAWHTYHYMEAPTAGALAALLIVLLVVMGRWIDRYSKEA